MRVKYALFLTLLPAVIKVVYVVVRSRHYILSKHRVIMNVYVLKTIGF